MTTCTSWKSPWRKAIDIFRFADFEDLVQAAIRIHPLVEQSRESLCLSGTYYLVFDRCKDEEFGRSGGGSLRISGKASTVTEHVLMEDGTTVGRKMPFIRSCDISPV